MAQPLAPNKTRHWFYWSARRARRRWMRSLRGRDAYVHQFGRFNYLVSRIDYRPPRWNVKASEALNPVTSPRERAS